MGGFKNLEDLVGDLESGLQKLRAGKLEPEELTPLVDDARELCDRLVLLRFKAHEFAFEVRRKLPDGGVDEQAVKRQPVRPFRIGAAYQTSLIDAIEEVSREQAEQAADERRLAGTPNLFDVAFESAAAEPEEASISAEELQEASVPGVDSTEVSAAAEESEEVSVVVPNETSVDAEEAGEASVEDLEVDSAAAEVEEVQSPVFSSEGSSRETPIEPVVEAQALTQDAAPSLAEQMENKAIGDLRTAFSLVEKYECIKGLFQDDAVLFDRVLEALDGAGDYQLALLWLKQHVPGFGTWDQEDPTVLRFFERIQRRYA